MPSPPTIARRSEKRGDVYRQVQLEEGKPVHLQIPRRPRVSPTFESTLSETDFSLTDEHLDDNTQQSLLGITDGFQVLDYYLAKWSETVHQMQFAGNQTRFRSC